MLEDLHLVVPEPYQTGLRKPQPCRAYICYSLRHAPRTASGLAENHWWASGFQNAPIQNPKHNVGCSEKQILSRGKNSAGSMWKSQVFQHPRSEVGCSQGVNKMVSYHKSDRHTGYVYICETPGLSLFYLLPGPCPAMLRGPKGLGQPVSCPVAPSMQSICHLPRRLV